MLSPANTKTKPGERNGRADSFPRNSDADSAKNRRVSRRSLRLSHWQALAALLSNAARVSLLRHGPCAGGRAEPQVSRGKGYLEPLAEGRGDQSEFGRDSGRVWCSRCTQRRADLLGGTRAGRTTV